MPVIKQYATNSSSIINEIKKPNSRVFRKLYIKRRDGTTGAFESSWQEITKDVIRWGKVGANVDHERYGFFDFIGTNLVMQNKEGRYNPSTSSESLWSGYADQQRTLVKIEAGFIHQWQDTNGLWHNDTYPTDPTVFVGIISGNINYDDSGQVTLPVKPLTQVFKEFALSRHPTTPTGAEISSFATGLRDMTIGGSYVFRPFFNNTTSYWDLTNVPTLTGKAEIFASPVSDDEGEELDVWTYLEENARAFNLFPYITPTGVFKFTNKNVGASATFYFHGAGINKNTQYGTTIKNVSFYGKKLTNYYSKVSYKFKQLGYPSTRNETQQEAHTSLAYSISGSNLPWVYGDRILVLPNRGLMTYFQVGDSTTLDKTMANTLCSQIFNEVSRVDEEIEFTTSFIPHLNLLDRVEITYDSSDMGTNLSGYWDLNDWDTELTWDAGDDGAIVLSSEPFKLLSIELDLDNLESTFIARQIN